MFHSVGRIMGWAKNYRKRMILGFVCSFFATWCTAGPVMLAAWALGRMIGNAWGENELSGSLPIFSHGCAYLASSFSSCCGFSSPIGKTGFRRASERNGRQSSGWNWEMY